MLNLSKLVSVPKWKTIRPLIFGGFSVQLRSIAIEIAYLALSRAAHSKDASGISAAAHAISMQIWLLAGVVLYAMSTVSSILVPNEIAKGKGDFSGAKAVADRLLVIYMLSFCVYI
jgi:Na+-driven multidrug efflux pump